MAAHAVLENRDLLKNVLWTLWHPRDALAPLGTCITRDNLVTCLQNYLSVASVNRVFRTVTAHLLDELWNTYQRCMSRFDRSASLYVEMDHPPFKALCDMARGYLWPLNVFNFNCTHVPWSDSQVLLQQYQLYMRPTNPKELLHMVMHKCACCDGKCELVPQREDGQPSPWVGLSNLGGWLLHPYRGKLAEPSVIGKMGCGCYPRTLQGQFVPHTHCSHFFELAFVRNFDGTHKAQLRIFSGDATREEQRVNWFLHGARREEWYQPRIKRLFDLRPSELADPKSCCTAWKRAARASRTSAYAFLPPAEFEVSVCLLEPRIPDNADCSVQQIFGLTREKTLALVRRGRKMLNERRRLSNYY
jgi:hypothetical protein